MPHREERLRIETSRSGKDGIGGHARQALVNQVLVRRAAAERAWIVSAGVSVLRLDEHQGKRGALWVLVDQAELASIVHRAPRVANGACMRRAGALLEHGR